MWISVILVILCFLGVIICILTEKLNRAIASLIGTIITYFVLIFLEGFDFAIIVDLLFGNIEDGFVNLHSIILILAMMIIVVISTEAGLFQFIALRLIQLSKGKSIRLLIIICFITVLISAVLNNILTVIILIPLIITVSRILNIDPSPYILTQAVLVNIGGTVFSISSIPNILITTEASISFVSFFLNVGLLSFMVFGFTLIFFILLYRKELVVPSEGIEILKEFDAWAFVPDKILLYKSLVTLITLMTLFVVLPSYIFSPDILALTIAIILVIISGLEPKELIKKIDFELLLYLLGIFIITGAFELVGVTSALANIFTFLGGTDLFIQILVILWISAFLSSSIDNIPITKVLIPVIGDMTAAGTTYVKNQAFYALTFGANWGDNLTPMGDNILVVNIAEQNKRPISMKAFFKLGFFTTTYQLLILSLYFTFVFHFVIGFVISFTILILILILYIVYKTGTLRVRSKLDKLINLIRKVIIK